MFANPDEFQAIVVHCNKNIIENCTLKVNNIEIESKNSVKLLGIEIDNKLLFDKHIASYAKKKRPISYMQYADYKTKWVKKKKKYL